MVRVNLATQRERKIRRFNTIGEKLILLESKENTFILTDMNFTKGSILLNEMAKNMIRDGRYILSFPFTEETIIKMLRFGENERIELDSEESVFNLFKISSTYQIKKLKSFCYNIILQQLNVNNVFQYYDLALITKENLLISKCWKVFSDSDWKILITENFLKCSEESLTRILSQPFSYISEYKLFISLYTWGKGKLKTNSDSFRRMIFPYLKCIWFLTMKREEMENVVLMNWLRPAEKTSFLNYINEIDDTLPEWVNRNIQKRNFNIKL